MLTLTYALVALSVEHKKVQGRLLELQQEILREKDHRFLSDQRYFDSVLARFMQLDDACMTRNLELFVFPAVRLATSEADSVFAYIDELAAIGRAILKNVREHAHLSFAQGSMAVEELCNSLDLYAQNLIKRLVAEESQIMPLAQRVISSNEWFDIAAQFISHESKKQVRHNRFGDATEFEVPHTGKAVTVDNNTYLV